MAFSLYFDVDLRPDCPSPVRTMEMLVWAVHAMGNGDPMAIDFPNVRFDRAFGMVPVPGARAKILGAADDIPAGAARGRGANFVLPPLGMTLRVFAQSTEVLDRIRGGLMRSEPFDRPEREQPFRPSKVRSVPGAHAMRLVRGIRQVPPGAKEARLAEHLARKGIVLEMPIEQRRPDDLHLYPLLRLGSRTTNGSASRRVKIEDTADSPDNGRFDSYGFSLGGLVPHFL